MRTIIHLIVLLLLTRLGFSQVLYQTAEGSIRIVGEYKSEQKLLSSNDLYIRLDYETTEIELFLQPTSLSASVDSSLLVNFMDQFGTMELSGKLNIPYASMINEASYDLNFEAELTLNGTKQMIYPTGKLEQVDLKNQISCLLTLDFSIKPTQFGIELPAGWENQMNIHIFQEILEKTNQ